MSNCAVCGKHVKSGIVVHSECFELLQKTQQLDNKPLTIEELRGMAVAGEPVWAKDGTCYLVGADLVVATDKHGHFRRLPALQIAGLYRRKPIEWISVKDRLPEYCAPVLVWDGEYRCARIVNYVGGEFFDEVGDDVTVSHWMTLPEPPEVE